MLKIQLITGLGMIALAAVMALAQDAPREQFVPANSATASTLPSGDAAPASTLLVAGTLQMRSSAVVAGSDIHLKQVFRWSDSDAPSFAHIADLVIERFDDQHPMRKIYLHDVKTTLAEAGVNLGAVRFSGVTSCDVSQSGVIVSDVVAKTEAKNPATRPVASASASIEQTGTATAFHTLRAALIADAAQRMNIAVDHLQIAFDPKDDNLLNMAEPTFHFELHPRRIHDLGTVLWKVVIQSGTNRQVVDISGEARAWEDQVVVQKAAEYHQVLQNDDLVDRRVLVDELREDQLLTRDQIVGAQASRDLKPGTVMTARLIDPLPMAKAGQYVTVTLTQGSVQITTVAKALETGCYGQSIKVKNEETHDTFQVTLVGPQQATMGVTPAQNAPVGVKPVETQTSASSR